MIGLHEAIGLRKREEKILHKDDDESQQRVGTKIFLIELGQSFILALH